MSMIQSDLLLGQEGGSGYQIQRSLRFNPADSSFLSRTPASAGNRKTWTWAGWVKRSALQSGTSNTYMQVFSAGTSATARDVLFFDTDTDDTLAFYSANGIAGAATLMFRTNAVFRDASAWMHIMLAVDTTQATASNRVKLYANGTEQTFSTVNYPSQNAEGYINLNNAHYIATHPPLTEYFSGYLAEVYLIDGQALTPTSFGEFDTNNIWQPKAYSGTYGTNGFHLDFADNSSAAALGTDTSGNGNNWTPNNLTAGPAVVSNSWSGYFDGNGDYLTAPANAAFAMGTGDFTIEFWVYPNQRNAGTQFINLNTSSASGSVIVGLNGSQALEYYNDATRIADSVAFPLGSWTHVALCRSYGTTRLFKNGTQVGSSYSDSINCVSTNPVRIGARHDGAGYVNGYISNLRIVKASAVYTSNFTSPTAPLTAITNTSLLTLKNSTFVDNSTNNFTITAVGNARVDSRSPFEEPVDTDSFVDSPTNYGTDTGAGGEVRGNYATWNALDRASSGNLTNGNLDWAAGGGVGFYNIRATIFPESGKYYWEVIVPTIIYGTSGCQIGLADRNCSFTVNPNTVANAFVYANNGSTYRAGVSIGLNASYTTGDVIGLAFDRDSNTLAFYKNGVAQTSSISTLPSDLAPFVALYHDAVSGNAVVNFGQRPFAYTAPSGFKALCTQNLPEGSITTSGSFTGNANADGPFVWLNGVPNAMTINGNAVTFGTHADKLSNGFKLRTSSTTYNTSGSNTYSITTTGAKFKNARAQTNP